MRSTSRWILVLLFGAWWYGCAEGAPTTFTLMAPVSPSPMPAAGEGAPGVGPSVAPSFATTVLPLINAGCSCHQSEPVLMAPFSLKPAEAFTNLVNKPSTEAMGMNLVAPGSLEMSYLWHKLRDTQAQVGGSGQRMPSTMPLTEPEIAVVEAWILGGAQP